MALMADSGQPIVRMQKSGPPFEHGRWPISMATDCEVVARVGGIVFRAVDPESASLFPKSGFHTRTIPQPRGKPALSREGVAVGWYRRQSAG
jgi:hypothetical protein